MIKEKIFMGESVDPDSPISNTISEAEAIQNASFGAYNYDPLQRLTSQQPIQQQIGGWNYFNTSNGYYPQQPNQAFYYQQPTMVGLGANPYNYNQNPYYNNFNPYNPFQSQQIPNQNITINIPPINHGGEFLPTIDYEEKIEQLKQEFMIKEQEQAIANSSNNYNNYGYNYYGFNYYNGGYAAYNNIRQEAAEKIREIQEEARNARKEFELKLSKLAHNYSGIEYDENVLEEMYNGKTIEIPCMNYSDLFTYNRFNNLVPFDNSQDYRNHYLAVSAEFNKYIPANATNEEFSVGMYKLNTKYELEEEEHRRRNQTVLYDSSDDGYRCLIKQKLAERYAEKHGCTVLPSITNNNFGTASSLLNQFSTLKNGASLTEDGTLNISCNFGSKKGQVYSVNENEAKYDQDRERFNSFLNSIPGSIYNNPSSYN